MVNIQYDDVMVTRYKYMQNIQTSNSICSCVLVTTSPFHFGWLLFPMVSESSHTVVVDFVFGLIFSYDKVIVGGCW